MMIWVNTAAILGSAYVMAYSLARVAAFALPRVIARAPSPLPLGIAGAISLIGFCMVTGTPAAVILAMLAMAAAAVRYHYFAASPRILYGAALLTAAFVASLGLTYSGWQVTGVSPYLVTIMIAAVWVVVLGIAAQADALHLPVLLALGAISLVTPLVPGLPYHIALDGAIMLACVAAITQARRHIRSATALDSTFNLPACVMMLHGATSAILGLMKGLS